MGVIHPIAGTEVSDASKVSSGTSFGLLPLWGFLLGIGGACLTNLGGGRTRGLKAWAGLRAAGEAAVRQEIKQGFKGRRRTGLGRLKGNLLRSGVLASGSKHCLPGIIGRCARTVELKAILLEVSYPRWLWADVNPKVLPPWIRWIR